MHPMMNIIRKHMHKSIIYYLAVFMLLGITGCMVGGKFQSPVETSVAPEKFAQVEGTSDSAVLVKWFELYEDTVLLRYIRTTLDSNRNMLRAAARIEQSREIAGIVKANLYPSFGYSASAGGGTAGTDAQKVGGGIDNGAFKMYGTMNWEIDLWGKLRSANQASFNAFLADIEKLIRQKFTPVPIEGFGGRSSRHGERAERSDTSHSSHSSHASPRTDRARSDHRPGGERATRAPAAPRREPVDPWFLKPYEPSAPPPPQAEPTGAGTTKSNPAPKRAALLGGRKN
jgi:hypothetical protein